MLFQSQSEKRISLIASAVLITLTLVASISVYWVMRNQSDATYSRSLQLDLESRSRLVEYVIRQHVANSVAMAHQTLIQERLAQARGVGPDSTLEPALKFFLEQGVRALIVYDNNGREVARAGWKAQPQFDVALALPHPTRLGWSDGFILSTRVDVMQSGQIGRASCRERV